MEEQIPSDADVVGETQNETPSHKDEEEQGNQVCPIPETLRHGKATPDSVYVIYIGTLLRLGVSHQFVWLYTIVSVFYAYGTLSYFNTKDGCCLLERSLRSVRE